MANLRIDEVVKGNAVKHQHFGEDVSITDDGAYYNGTEVETALQEIASGTTLNNPYLLISNNLSEVAPDLARGNLDVYSTTEADSNFVDVGGDTMNGRLDGYILVNTRANIIATTPASNTLAYSTDYERFYVFDGSSWQETAVVFKPRTGGYDKGYEKNSSLAGYGDSYISDKTLHNIQVLGHPATKTTGSFWLDTTVTPSVLHIYANGATKDIKIDFTTANNELEHLPDSYTIDVWSGNSNQLGNNGLPLVQEYKASMGAYPVPLLINGGTF